MIDGALRESLNGRVFLHYFDIHFLELKKAQQNPKEIAREASLAARLAVLCCDEIVVPAASYFESSICKKVVQEFKSLYEFGVVWLVGSGANIQEFVFRKLDQYTNDSSQYAAYAHACFSELPPFLPRCCSATQDIQTDWLNKLYSGQVGKVFTASHALILPKDFENRWEAVPEKLEGRAFVVDYVTPLLLGVNLHPTVINRLHSVINESYFSSFVRELQARTISDLVYLAAPHMIPSVGVPVPFRALCRAARNHGLLEEIIRCDATHLVTVKEDFRWHQCVLEAHVQCARQAKASTYPTKWRGREGMVNLRSFIVHGRDNAAKLELKDYLQNTLGLPEPIILHQQANMGRTVIEKFEEHSSRVDVAFVLLTADDIGGMGTAEMQQRARQNVIFELGVFVGKFGRSSGRVILLNKGDLEMPSDLAGVIYIDIAGGIERAGEEIRRELMQLTVLH